MKIKLLTSTIAFLSAICFSSSAQCLKPVVDTVSGAVIQPGGLAPYASIIKWAHTVSSTKGTNRLLVVEVACDTLPDSVTYSGIKLTLLITATDTNYSAQMWYLIDPPTGSDTVKVFFRVGTGTFASHKSAEAISLYNVDQTTPFGTPVSSTDTVCPTHLVASSDTNSIILDMIVKDYFRQVTPDLSQTQLYSVWYANGNSVGGSMKNGGDTVSFSWLWTFCSSYPWAALAVPVEAVCITSVKKQNGNNIISSVYPNPAATSLYIQFSENVNEEMVFQVYDVVVKAVMPEVSAANKNNNKKQIDISALQRGVYFLCVKTAAGIAFDRFVKE